MFIRRTTRWDWLLAVVLLSLFPIYSLISGQDINYDARNYHLYSSLAFLANDYGSDLLPGGTQTFLNPLASLPAAWLYAASGVLGPLLPTLLFSLLQGFALVVVYAIGLLLFAGDRRLSFLAALLGGSAPLVLSEAGNTMADLTLSLLSVISLWLALAAVAGHAGPVRRRWLVALSAGLVGAAVGIKLTFVITLPLLGAVLLLGPMPPQGWRAALRRLLRGVAIVLLPFLLSLSLFTSPQLIHSSQNTGSPIYPLFNNHFRSPLHEDSHPTEGRFLPDSLPSFLLAPLFDFSDSFFPPFNPDMDLKTRRSEVLFRDLRPLLWALSSLALLLVPPLRHRLGRLQRAVVLGLAGSYVFWLGLSAIGRYAIPLQLLQGLVIALFCQQLLASLPVPQRRFGPALLLTAVLALSLASQITPSWGRSGFERHWTMIRSASAPALVPLSDGRLEFPPGVPIVLLNRPIGWIKSHTLASGNPLLNWDPGIAPATAAHSKMPMLHRLIQQRLLDSGFDSFLVHVIPRGDEVPEQRLRAFLEEAPMITAAGFRLGRCSHYEASSGLEDFSLCSVSQP
ncbi:hypothetical protein [Synechococcus sp. WH 5701]|uniref:hypothetical protein n=1 Tax=Synechococcus sp. WH 5701 TaxID=69042 RepID=UPI0000698423|nr:hypothetical protein [Synechococcus sp. WH 5701]EAQ75814.1 hypothetical protein WH5701_03174 [Synechococcus sp. WH 5701]